MTEMNWRRDVYMHTKLSLLTKEALQGDAVNPVQARQADLPPRVLFKLSPGACFSAVVHCFWRNIITIRCWLGCVTFIQPYFIWNKEQPEICFLVVKFINYFACRIIKSLSVGLIFAFVCFFYWYFFLLPPFVVCWLQALVFCLLGKTTNVMYFQHNPGNILPYSFNEDWLWAYSRCTSVVDTELCYS